MAWTESRGIPDELADRLFKPFVSMKHGWHGTRTVNLTLDNRAHDGQLIAAPNLGGGTVFRFTLRSRGA
jgi:nitrogen-specific signal transduction histidine kinase